MFGCADTVEQLLNRALAFAHITFFPTDSSRMQARRAPRLSAVKLLPKLQAVQSISRRTLGAAAVCQMAVRLLGNGLGGVKRQCAGQT